MTDENVRSTVLNKGLLGMLVPMFLGYLVFLLLPGIDAFFLSRISDESVAGVALVKRLLAMIMVFSLAFVFGTQSLASRYMGENAYDKVGSLLWTCLLIIGASGVVVALLCHWQAEWIIAMFEPGAEVAVNAKTYLQIFTWVIPLILLSNALIMVVNIFGLPAWSMYGSVILLVGNSLFNAIAVYGWLGLPKMGVAGVAGASVLSVCLSMLPLIYAVRHKLKLFRWPPPSVLQIQTDLRAMLKIGIPAFFEPFFVQASWLLFSYLLLKISDQALAAAMYTEIIFELSGLLLMAVSHITHAMVLQHLGAGQALLANRQLLRNCAFALLCSTFFAACILLFWQELLRVFTADTAIAALAFPAFLLSFLQMPFRSVNTVLSTILTGVGDGWYVTVNSAVSHFFFAFLLALLLFNIMDQSMLSIYLALLVNEIVRTSANSWRWYSRRLQAPNDDRLSDNEPDTAEAEKQRDLLC